MAHDVFISYSKENAAAASRVCEVLEDQGYVCWIAPRNIPGGDSWSSAIVQAIRGARVMVLLISQHANTSRQIPREVEIADSEGVPIIPFRLEPVDLCDEFVYFVGPRQWVDGYPEPVG